MDLEHTEGAEDSSMASETGDGPRPRPRPRPPRSMGNGDRPGMDVGNVQASGTSTERRRTQKTSERVAIEIVHDIMADGLRTGDRLPLEAAMVDQYRISRASLREALRLLEVQGLIRLKPGPGGGPVVGTVDPANLARTSALYFHLSGSLYQDLLQTQALVEPLCGQLACDHPDRAEALDPFTTAPDEPLDEAGYRDVTVAFHRTIYELADNPVLTILSGAVTHIVTDHVVATMDPVELRPAILQEHAEIARVIVAGDHMTARRLMTEHFERQHRYYAEHWPSRLRQLIEWR